MFAPSTKVKPFFFTSKQSLLKGEHYVIKYGLVRRQLHKLPFSSKPCYLSLQIQRYCCKSCGGVWQSDIPFTQGEVSYTHRFSSYVLDLLRMGNTIKDVARHLHVGWNMVKEIHKKYLKSKYSCPNIKEVRRIGIDEFATRKGLKNNTNAIRG